MPALLLAESYLVRRSQSGSCGGFGCFLFLVFAGLILYLVLKGRRDRPEQLGAAKRAMGSGPLADHVFPSPYVKCPTCAASGDKMKQQWDGLRKVTWTCGYCGNVAGVQELKDEELPPSARQRLGLDAPPPGFQQGPAGGFPAQGGGVGDLLTGMMIGGMMSGGHSGHHHRDDDWGSGGGSGGSSGGSDWGDGGSGGSTGGDWGDSGGDSGNDSGGGWGDAGGGDSGGDSGNDSGW